MDQSAKTKIATTGGGIAGLLLAIAAVLHYFPGAFQPVVALFATPSTRFDQSKVELVNDLQKQAKLPIIRLAALEAYSRADQGWTTHDKTAWKCSVIALFEGMEDPNVARALPAEAYSDYENAAFSAPCSTNLVKVAAFELYAFNRFPTQNDSGSANRLGLVRDIVAKGTTVGLIGWADLGLTDSRGDRYSIRYMREPSAKYDQTITASNVYSGFTSDGMLLHVFPPSSVVDGILGFLPNGSKATVLCCFERYKHGSDSYDVWAKAQVVDVQPLGSGVARASAHLQLARRIAGDVAMGSPPPKCQAFPQHNSRHGTDQLWVFAGEKADTNSDAFVPGTSLVNTPCVPRDGQIVRATKDLKVLIGADPYYPGVRAQGGIVVAGTDFRVVGDVSGYPFDSTKDADFCSRIPAPHKTKAVLPIPSGDKKRYCVYLPISPA